MATLTVLTMAAVTGGLKALVSAAGGGDQFANPSDARTYLEVLNGSGGSITVTITAQNTTFAVPGKGNLTAANGGGAVAAGAARVFGPFPAEIYNDSSGNVQVTYSGVTSLTVQAIKVPAP